MKLTLPAFALAFAAITGCAALSGGKHVAAQPAPQPAPQPAAAVDPLAHGKALYEGLCTSCHEASMVEAQGRTRAEWDEVTRRMLDRGLVATEDQLNQVVDYLAKTHPPEAAK